VLAGGAHLAEVLVKREDALEGGAGARIEQQRLGVPLAGRSGIAQPEPQELGALDQHGHPGAQLGGAGARAQQRLGQGTVGLVGAVERNQLLPGLGVVGAQGHRGLEVAALAGAVVVAVAGDGGQQAMRLVGQRRGRGAQQLERLGELIDSLGDAVQPLGHATQADPGSGVAGQRADRLEVAQPRVLQLGQRVLVDPARLHLRAASEDGITGVQLADAVERAQGTQGLAGAGAEIGQSQQGVGVVGGQAQRGVVVQPRAREIVLDPGTELAQADVGPCGLGGVLGDGGQAAVGAQRGGVVPCTLGSLGQGQQRGMVIRAQPQRLVQRAHGQRGGAGDLQLLSGDARRRLRRPERRGLLAAPARQRRKIEEARSRQRVLAPLQPQQPLHPQGRRRERPPLGKSADQIHRVVADVPIAEQERDEPLGGEGVGLGQLALAQEVAARALERSLLEVALALLERVGPLHREQQLLVGQSPRWRRAGREAQGDALGRDQRRAQPCRGHLRQPEALLGHGPSQELAERIDGDGAEAPPLHPRRKIRARGRLRQDAGDHRRGQLAGAVEPHVEAQRRHALARTIKGDATGEGDRLAAARPQRALGLEEASAQRQPQPGQLGGILEDALLGLADPRRRDLQIELTEEAALLLVARRAAGDVEGEGDVWNLQGQIGDAQTRCQLEGAQPDEGLAIDEAQLGARRGRRSAAGRPTGRHVRIVGSGLRHFGGAAAPRRDRARRC
jgi:hypothetical protein